MNINSALTQIEATGDAPLRAVIADLGGWPVLTEQWSSQQFVLEDVLAKMRGKYSTPLLFKCSVGVDDKNSSVNILQIQQGDLGMPSREYYLLKDHASHMQAYSQFMKDVVKLLGAKGPEVNDQLNDILNFEITLANFDLLRYLRGFVVDNITEDEPVVLFATQYMQNIAKLLHHTENRTLANYLIWRLVSDMVPELSEPYQQVEAQYKHVIQGVQRDSVRWKKCVKFVNEKMGMAVGAMFIKDNFKKESKETLNFEEDAFFDNFLKLLEFASKKMMEKLRQPVRQDLYEQDPVVVNAFYNPNTNNILFPAGILQPLFYSSVFPKSLNYGGIGVVIGHEITHGFDDKGRQYDKYGNIKQWWDDHTIQAFRERAQCIIDQYSQYKLDQIHEY
ncbi:unnamed protein product, partial [Candidula unifasciata]